MKPALILTLALLFGGTPPAHAAATEPSAQVSVTPVQKRSLYYEITVYGKVEPDPERLRAVTTLNSGEIKTLMVGLGQKVVRGQALIRIETSPQARKAYTQAYGKVASAQIKLQQTRDLFAQQLATRSDLANAEQNLKNLQAELHALHQQGADRRTQTLRAREAAVVTKLNVTTGTLVQPGQPLLMLGSLHHVWVRLGLEPEEVIHVRKGMPVRLNSVFGTRLIQARISQVHAVINPATHLVDAVVRLSGAAAKDLIPGSWMRGRLRLQTVHSLAVPRSAILSDEQGSYVYLIRSGKAYRVRVKPGIQSGGWIAVQGRLQAGNTVVTAGNYELVPGMPVRIIKKNHL